MIYNKQSNTAITNQGIITFRYPNEYDAYAFDEDEEELFCVEDATDEKIVAELEKRGF